MIELIYNLVYSEDSVDYDFRIFFVSQFSNDKPPIKLCLGDNYLTLLNSQQMKVKKDLFVFFDKLIY